MKYKNKNNIKFNDNEKYLNCFSKFIKNNHDLELN